MFPGRRPFYKYTTPETALAVVSNGNFRYSSPLSFNDPFDIQSGLHFDFELNTFHDKLLDRIETLAASVEDPSVDEDDVWGKVVIEARKYYPTHGFPKDRWRVMTAQLFKELEQTFRETQAGYKKHWRERLLPGIRVFCVSEELDNLLMWAHYAKDHQGVVFEMWSLPDEDNPLSVARPVDYLELPPPFCTEQDLLDDMTGIKKLDLPALYRKYAYAKSSHWRYEKEWRVWYPNSTSTLFDYTPINPKELQAVYIGCQADPAFILQLVGMIRAKYPQTRILQAFKSSAEYRLQFTDA